MWSKGEGDMCRCEELKDIFNNEEFDVWARELIRTVFVWPPVFYVRWGYDENGRVRCVLKCVLCGKLYYVEEQWLKARL